MVIDRTVSNSIGEHCCAAADMIARARERGVRCSTIYLQIPFM
ncbi:unnamed protein product [Ectocarpus sp. 13 AM-2016]